MVTPETRSSRLHRLLLRLHPRSFRDGYRDGIEETLARRRAEARRKGASSRFRFWFREAVGLTASLLREHIVGQRLGSLRSLGPSDRVPLIPVLLREGRHGLRRLIRAPGFTLPAVLTLALAIGANAAIFTVVRRVVVSPLPYPESDRLVALDHGALGIGYPEGMGITSGVYWQYAQRARTLESVTVHQSTEMTLSDGAAESILVTRTTDSFTRVMRVEPALGRWFDADEASPGGRSVAVLSHGLWQRRYGGDPAVIGRTIELAGVPNEVIGVMPADFALSDRATELWIALQLGPTNVRAGGFNFSGIGRLAEGATVADARAETSRLIPQLPEDFPDDEYARAMVEDARIVSNIIPLKEEVVGSVVRTLWTLFGAVGVVLLVACANVTNLFLVRTENRHREVAVRRALGAGRRGIASFFLMESLVLVAIGGAVGLALAFAGVKLLVAFGPADLPRLAEVRVDAAVLGFTAALSIAVALFLAAVPFLRRGPALAGALHEIGRGNTASAGRTRTRSVLMATQVALALVLLIGAGLMARSFQRLAAVDPGFDPENGLVYRVILPPSTYETREAAAAFHRQLLERVRALPGVGSASATTCPPLNGLCFGDPIGVYGRPAPEGALGPVTSIRRVADDYFRVAGMRLLRGQLFEPQDHARATRVAVVDERLAELYFPGEDPIGQRVFASSDDEAQPYQIVGVVNHVTTFGLRSENRPPQLYLPMLSHTSTNTPGVHPVRYIVRTSSDRDGLVTAVRREIAELDPNLALSGVTTLERMLADDRASTAFTMVLIVIAGSLALVLGVIGIYGVISYVVSQRTGEIGMRIALGARPGNVAAMILRQGGAVVGLGLAVGLAGALAASNLLEAMLFDVSTTDPATYAVVVLGLLLVSLLACWLPARRAAGLDPVAALRNE